MLVSPEIPSISSDFGILDKCVGESLTLRSSIGENIEWSTGEATPEIRVVEPGIYSVAVEDACGRIDSAPVEVSDLQEVELPLVVGDTLPAAGSGVLMAMGDSLHWYDQEFDGQLLATGSTFQTPVLASNTSYWVENLAINPLPVVRGAKADREPSGIFLDSNPEFRYLTLQVDRPLVVRSVRVYAEEAGERKIRFFNKWADTVIAVVDRMIPAGESRVELNVALPRSEQIWVAARGDDGLFADTEKNRLAFPYALGLYGAVTGSFDGNYYFFYDWEIEPAPIVCASPRVPVELYIKTGVHSIAESDLIDIFPNPAQDRLQIQIQESLAAQVSIYDVQGSLRYRSEWSSTSISVADWPRGWYWVQVRIGAESYLGKILLQ